MSKWRFTLEVVYKVDFVSAREHQASSSFSGRVSVRRWSFLSFFCFELSMTGKPRILLYRPLRATLWSSAELTVTGWASARLNTQADGQSYRWTSNADVRNGERMERRRAGGLGTFQRNLTKPFATSTCSFSCNANRAGSSAVAMGQLS